MKTDADIIIDGALFCSQCSRFYPIIDEIPIMLPDELRNKNNDMQFLQQWKDKLPSKIINSGKPWHLV
ncbi:MAG TPA: Trm112 family protein, partial [Nitrososphaerales archaeon]|nr:Trm112 family protein [Nitrososphaerales archaeon]